MITYYKSHYKYQLKLERSNPDVIQWRGDLWYKELLCFDAPPVRSDFLRIVNEEEGSYLLVKDGYAWDGASGPTIDTKNTQTASLVHDALWQLIAAGKLPEDLRDASNDEFHAILIDKGVWPRRARVWKISVAKFGAKWVKLFGTKRKLISAP